jgi:hypothetical protein
MHPPFRRPRQRASRLATWLSRTLVFGSCLLLPGAVYGQVNVESLRSSIRDSGLGGKVNVSVATYQGNTRGTNLGASGLLGVRDGVHLAYAHANGRYSHLGGEVQVANYFAHLRYNYDISSLLAVEALTQAESDRFRRLQLRQLLGVGARVTALAQPAAALYVGLTYMLEYNRLAEGESPVRPDVVQRLSSYVSGVLDIEEARAVATTTLYYQPRPDALADYRMLVVSSLEFRVVGHLSAGLHATLRQESPVPDDVDGLDLTVTNTLGLSF